MRLKDFEYDLPEELIAQHPLKERGASRMMVMDRSTGAVRHGLFRDLKDHLRGGDLLILNDTRVMRARLLGAKKTGGRAEALLIRRLSSGDGREEWECLVNAKGTRAGVRFRFDGGLEAEVKGRSDDGHWVLGFSFAGDFEKEVERLGRVPLPPYIRREAGEEDVGRYQTVFAERTGAVAAPTAGLHFTNELLDELRGMGIEVRFITLHTGPGTFLPVRTERVEDHRMGKEYYMVREDVFAAVLRAKEENRRVIAVGTTSARALESAVIGGFEEPALEGWTGVFICPGFKFKVIDGLLTNLHLPGSTLIMLVSAFAGLERTMEAYREAVRERYRFFSYGDAMLIL